MRRSQVKAFDPRAIFGQVMLRHDSWKRGRARDQAVRGHALLGIALLLASACGGTTTPGTDATPIRLGIVGAFSGPLQLYGDSIRIGAEMAVRDINAKGGASGHKLTLTERDDEGDPGKSLGYAKELIQGGTADALLGAATSGTTTSILPFVSQMKFPHIMPSASGLTIDPAKYPYTFKTSKDDSATVRSEFDLSLAAFNFKKPALLIQSDAYGSATLPYFEAAIAAHPGLQFATIQRIDVAAKDATPQAINIRNSGADILFATTYPAVMATFIRSVQAVNYWVPTVSDAAFQSTVFFDLMPQAPAQSYTIVSKQLLIPHSPAVDKLITEAAQANPKLTLSWDLLCQAYDAVGVLASVADKNGGKLSGDTFKKTMESTGYKGIFDTYGWSSTNHGHVLTMALVDASKLNKTAVSKGDFNPLGK
jgi:branched-chain amino acid transport system substrate-binding protein